MKKLISSILLVFICLFVIQTNVFAIETDKMPLNEYANQKCGDKVFYYLENNNKTLKYYW